MAAKKIGNTAAVSKKLERGKHNFLAYSSSSSSMSKPFFVDCRVVR
eukprot:CAMPEP_0195507912 /NCGR_PEP_ID=MMETSP0794_2-20130614/1266_1 /TAXON_ID=515487 /ORGANISM="Stephanopyxis turris, Strain CCMP 815" /LENGTH=45 /DNA_ID= /DNA_START= /DNA_END= /DNA_ORIENTATION=